MKKSLLVVGLLLLLLVAATAESRQPVSCTPSQELQQIRAQMTAQLAAMDMVMRVFKEERLRNDELRKYIQEHVK